jgi:hypothetical protein
MAEEKVYDRYYRGNMTSHLTVGSTAPALASVLHRAVTGKRRRTIDMTAGCMEKCQREAIAC